MSEEQLTKLEYHLRFDQMAKNQAVNGEALKDIGVTNKEGHFIRKGLKICFFFKL